MRRISSKSLRGTVAMAKASKSKGRAMASSEWYSTIPPPKDQDLEEEEEEEEEQKQEQEQEQYEFSLKDKDFVAFPKGFPGAGGFLADKKKENDKSTASEKGSYKNYEYGQGSGKPDYGGGCSGCHGCSRCLGCSGGCRYRSGDSN